MELYRIVLKVRPDPKHPMFWDIEGAFLSVWIFSTSANDAGDRAKTIVEQLHWELVGCECLVTRITEPSFRPEFARCERDARAVGLALFVDAWRPGVDEEGFETCSFI